jgi:hypothetical protein
LCLENPVQGFEIADIIQCIFDLQRRERTLIPSRSRFRFSQRHLQKIPQDGTEPHRVIMSNETGGDLYIEQLRRHATNTAVAKLHFASAGMDDNFPLAIAEELPERGQVGNGHRIDQCQESLGGNLNETQFRLVFAFGNELGIVGNRFRRLQSSAKTGQLFCGRNG